MERLAMLGALKATVGHDAPGFNCKAIVDGRIKEISLSQFAGRDHWIVLMFFPMAWSFICPTEIMAFDARLAEFHNRNTTVIFASTDSEHVLKSWNSTDKAEGGLGGVRIPMISDRTHRLAKDYGVLVEEEGVAQRATFIIDPKAVVRYSCVNDDNIGRSVEEMKRLLDALMFADKFGEGCPVDWKSGDRGIRMSRDDEMPMASPMMMESPPHMNGYSNNPPLKSPPIMEETPSPAIKVPERPGLNRGSSWSGWAKSYRPKAFTNSPEMRPEMRTGGWPFTSNDDAFVPNSGLVH